MLEQVSIERNRDLNSNVNVCNSDNSISETSIAKVAYAILPYKGKVGEKVLKSLKSSLKKSLLKETCMGVKLDPNLQKRQNEIRTQT